VPGDGRTDRLKISTDVQKRWNGLMNDVTNAMNRGEALESARGYLQPLTTPGQLFASASKDGALILDILDAAGDGGAAFAYGLLRGGVSVGEARTRVEMLAAMLVAVPDLADAGKFATRLQQERANYRNSIRSAIDRIEEAEDERKSDFETRVARGTRIANRTLWRSRDNWRRVQKGWQSQAAQAVLEINAVQAAYLESMRLQAPVKYWSDKAEAHGKKEFWGIVRLIVFFPVALAALSFAFWEAGRYLLDHAANPDAKNPVALYVVITGGLAVVSTMLFWVGRLLTKLYLSEHHLRNDAEERAVMTETYLALTKEADASDADRDIILAAIFRNTPDGIVRDDGPGDVMPQAMMAKFMSSLR
jgi:hypothetical protein